MEKSTYIFTAFNPVYLKQVTRMNIPIHFHTHARREKIRKKYLFLLKMFWNEFG